MGNQCEANIALVSVKEGDYVLMHAGCVIEVLKRMSRNGYFKLFEELREVSNEMDAVIQKTSKLSGS